MSVKTITETPRELSRPPVDPFQGPSALREDDLSGARVVGLVSACLVLFGGLILVMNWAGRATLIGPGVGSLGLVMGLVGLLFHASVDRDLEFRHIYRTLGWALLVVGAFIGTMLPYPKNYGDLFSFGYPLMVLGLLFQIAPLRNETDPFWRNMTQAVLGGAGGIMAVVSLIGGFWFADSTRDFLLPVGLLVAILGLVYLVACVASKGTSDDMSYRIGLGIGLFGALVFVLALIRSIWPSILRSPNSTFFLPWGLLLMGLGLVYIIVSLALVSEARLVVMTRRELGSFFYSPMAYMILLGFALCHWLAYYLVASRILDMGRMQEPIVANFILQWPSIFFVIFAIPALTMRLLSEERRTGTLEVTLTTPVDEGQIVLSKFLAAWLMYLLMWLPFAFYMIAFRVGVAKDFDYRPLLSFTIGMIVTGAGFISMGVFFSSLTRNQVISGVMTFTGMLGLTLVFFVENYLQSRGSEMGMGGQLPSVWVPVLKHISYIDVWIETMQGQLVLRQLVAPVTATILWLFLSVKVLEARKWL